MSVSIAVGLCLTLGEPARRALRVGAVALIACAALTAAAYLLPVGRLQDQLSGSGVSPYGITATTFTGSGFRLALIGAVVTAAGGCVVLTGSRTKSIR